ncbi:MAG TPA: protein-L-isoaspartate(D-aspartate) O-methyltransferase [Thermoanaerobaculia bacterium]|nr:protein-L-isoaspartate(D-aspartate) O-methyltransferase [Thermoanaerobaculia bacterium]
MPEQVAARAEMVETQLRDRGIDDQAVLSAMGAVPRQLFVPAELVSEAYADLAIPFGKGQSIHQPYLVALMTSLLELDRGAKVLEIGTGSGYHTAVLAKLAFQVFSIEIDADTAALARKNLAAAGVKNAHVRTGDGYQGWPEEEPFDAIILTAAPPRVPQPLLDQLRVKGKMVLPEGDASQNLVVITKTEDGYERRTTVPVKVTPMTGKVRKGPG